MLNTCYWDMKVNKSTQLYNYAKVVVTDEAYDFSGSRRLDSSNH
jgi:hypothetical protein